MAVGGRGGVWRAWCGGWRREGGREGGREECGWVSECVGE